MTQRSYTQAIDDVLQPLGFRREKREWTRVRGDMQENLDLQKSSASGAVTVNVWAWDIETENILKGIACKTPPTIRAVSTRVGSLIDGRDRWWKNNPDGPMEVAAAVQAYCVPWFDKVRSLEEQAARWYGRGATGQWRNPNLPALAVTLYRLGALDEALALFEAPVPKTAIATLVSEGWCVQRWLMSQRRGS